MIQTIFIFDQRIGKTFSYAGFGFIIANIIQTILSVMEQQILLTGKWSNLSFGIILALIGLNLKGLSNNMKKSQKAGL